MVASAFLESMMRTVKTGYLFKSQVYVQQILWSVNREITSVPFFSVSKWNASSFQLPNLHFWYLGLFPKNIWQVTFGNKPLWINSQHHLWNENVLACFAWVTLLHPDCITGLRIAWMVNTSINASVSILILNSLCNWTFHPMVPQHRTSYVLLVLKNFKKYLHWLASSNIQCRLSWWN